MKNPLLLLAFLFLSTYGMSQEIKSQKEVGISLSNFDSFGLFYRVGKPDALWRFNSVFGSAYSDQEKGDDASRNSDQINLGVSAGREFRKKLADGLESRLGFDVAFSYYSWKYENTQNPDYTYTQRTETFSPGAYAVIGLNYVIKEKFIFGAELFPGFRYTTGTETTKNVNGEKKTTDITKASIDISNSIRLTAGYRF